MELNTIVTIRSPFENRRGFMSAEIVENKMNSSATPSLEQDLVEEGPAILGGFGRGPAPDGFPCGGTEGGEKLKCAVPAAVAVGTPGCFLSPAAAASRDCLQWPHLIEANHRPVCRRIAVERDYGVFFTSKSGSELSHQVCPVRNRSPY